MLVITLYPGGQDSFRVGDTQVKLVDLNHSKKFRLRVIGTSMDHDFWITDAKMTQILPQCQVMAGDNASPGSVKVAIEAPPAIRVLREALWQKEQTAGNK
jgi:hypothetical protein